MAPGLLMGERDRCSCVKALFDRHGDIKRVSSPGSGNEIRTAVIPENNRFCDERTDLISKEGSLMFARILDAKVRTKIFGLITIVLVGLGVFGVVAFDTLETVRINGPVYNAIIEKKDLVADILPPPEYLVESYLLVLQMLYEQERKELDALVMRSAKLREEYETRHEYWEKTLAPGELRNLMVVRSYDPAKRFLDIRDKEFIPAIIQGNLEKANALAQGEMKRTYEEHRFFIDKVVTLATEKTAAEEKNAQSIVERRTVTQGAVAVIVVATSLLTAFLFSRYIATTVNEYLSFAGKVARGDLTVQLHPKGNDELGALGGHLNDMVRSLGAMTREIRTSAQQITTATSEILGTVSQYTASADQQSTVVNATAATVEQVRSTAEQSARQAEEVSRLSKASLTVGQDGLQAVQVIVTGMEDIRAQVQAIAQNILALSERSQQIGDITSTVNDIADQSNLLALNAAIEAARSDSHGKGFAVVAGEVRVLAEQSKRATSDVRTILSEIANATHSTVVATEQGAHGVEAGLKLAQKAGQVIEELERAIRKSAQAAQHITASMQQQRESMGEIVQAMTGINEATSQFLAGAQQSQQAAEGLNDRARRLQSMTEQYRLDS
jgi:methyl-accepting chemotaxis protein